MKLQKILKKFYDFSKEYKSQFRTHFDRYCIFFFLFNIKSLDIQDSFEKLDL